MSDYRPTGRTKIGRLQAELHEQLIRYEDFIRDPKSPLELGSDLSKFACVRICGYLEQSVASLAIAHCENRSAPSVGRFAASWLARNENPKREALIAFAQRFEHEWGEELAELFERIDPTETFNSLVQTRNDIAHGLSTGIGHDTLMRHLDLVDEVVNWFADHLEPRP